MAAWRYEISLLVLKKYFTRSLRSLVKYFSTREEKFRISARSCNILYISIKLIKITDLCYSPRGCVAEWSARQTCNLETTAFEFPPFTLAKYIYLDCFFCFVISEYFFQMTDYQRAYVCFGFQFQFTVLP